MVLEDWNEGLGVQDDVAVICGQDAAGDAVQGYEEADFQKANVPATLRQKLTFWVPVIVGTCLLGAGWTVYARFPNLVCAAEDI